MARDPDFEVDACGLLRALELLGAGRDAAESGAPLPPTLPVEGIGPDAALEVLAPAVLGNAARLDAPHAFAHMDPPTPWLTWALTLWNARLNQNLLHPATAPFARKAEALVVDWLAPMFGMDGGHMTPGSTISNLTALWAARDVAGATRVVASTASHMSIAKSARLLGMGYEEVPVDRAQRLDASRLPDLANACLVVTAGTTSAGAIDPLDLCGRAAWTHVDAAWAGPLRLSARHASRLDGIDRADSVAVSAHKWLFQPKESALVFFRDTARANTAISSGGAYLAAPNVGVLGSHGAAAVPLLGTLLAWGRSGIAERLDRCMAAAERLAVAVQAAPGLELFAVPQTGVVLFRSVQGRVDEIVRRAPSGMTSTTIVDGGEWIRCVAANPTVRIDDIIDALVRA
ncbi:pyridoxal phosphate-dependent decarboxylase family protein [Lysobacter humi (ex Lee et al. 2017)]